MAEISVMTMKQHLCAAACLLALAASAQEPKEPVEALRQRLADRLTTPAEGAAVAKPAARGARPARLEAAKAGKAAHWGYAGDIGPDRWAELSQDNKLCAVGTRQSPIDIRDGL